MFTALGLSPILGFLVSFGVLILIVELIGKKAA